MYYAQPNYRCKNNNDDRGLLLPFLVGAAVAFPIGYIASNTNNSNKIPQYPYVYMPNNYPIYPYNPYMYNMMPYY